MLRAEGSRTAQVLEAEGKSRAIDQVFQAIHRNDPDPKLLAYQYLQTLPQLARGPGTSLFVIPSEVTAALQEVSRAFTEALPKSPATRDDKPAGEPDERTAEDAALAASAAAGAVANASEPAGICGLAPGDGHAAPASSLQPSAVAGELFGTARHVSA